MRSGPTAHSEANSIEGSEKEMLKVETDLLLLLLIFTCIPFAGGRPGTGSHHFPSCTSTAEAVTLRQL